MSNTIEDDATTSGSDQLGETKSLLERIASELWRLNESEAMGELAALRRMRRHDLPPAAFHRLMARAGTYEMGTDAVRRWARAVAIMAQRPDALKASGLGETLKAIGFSGQRLDMLLYARGPAFYDIALRTAVRIAKSGETLPYRDLCHLVLYDDQPEKAREADNVRIRVAQSFLRASDKATDVAAASTAPTA